MQEIVHIMQINRNMGCIETDMMDNPQAWETRLIETWDVLKLLPVHTG